MPELPEVETIKCGLRDKTVGKKITDIEILNPKSFLGDKRDVVDSKITDIVRRAKVMQIKLSNGLNLLFHLKLTGQLIHQNHGIEFAGGHPDHEWHHHQPGKNTRIIFTFDDGSKLFFNDLRKFGWCKVLTSKGVEMLNKAYGLDPFDKKFDVNYLLSKSKNIPNRKIKQFLMDQAIAPGMGNIYTDETLFDAKISPLRKLKDIKLFEWTKIRTSILKILKLAIRHGGTTDSDYVNADGQKGGMQDFLKVYRRTGQACACGGVVKRITIGGRGTHFCDKCQK